MQNHFKKSKHFWVSHFLPPYSFSFPFLSHLSFVSLNFLLVFLPLVPSLPSTILPPSVPDSNIKQVGKNGQAIMIYDQCMQRLLTFIMTVVGGGRDVCMHQSQGCVLGRWGVNRSATGIIAMQIPADSIMMSRCHQSESRAQIWAVWRRGRPSFRATTVAPPPQTRLPSKT